jgi:hypothetical protein
MAQRFRRSFLTGGAGSSIASRANLAARNRSVFAARSVASLSTMARAVLDVTSLLASVRDGVGLKIPTSGMRFIASLLRQDEKRPGEPDLLLRLNGQYQCIHGQGPEALSR